MPQHATFHLDLYCFLRVTIIQRAITKSVILLEHLIRYFKGMRVILPLLWPWAELN